MLVELLVLVLLELLVVLLLLALLLLDKVQLPGCIMRLAVRSLEAQDFAAPARAGPRSMQGAALPKRRHSWPAVEDMQEVREALEERGARNIGARTRGAGQRGAGTVRGGAVMCPYCPRPAAQIRVQGSKGPEVGCCARCVQRGGGEGLHTTTCDKRYFGAGGVASVGDSPPSHPPTHPSPPPDPAAPRL